MAFARLPSLAPRLARRALPCLLAGALGLGGNAAQAGGAWSATSLDPATQGSQPAGQLVVTADGASIGTALAGGANGAGTVFGVDAAGHVTVLHAFSGSDGYGPIAGLARGSDGLYYGTTALGGDHGLGVVYRISAQGDFELLHSFDPVADHGASGVSSALTLGPDGNFYGTSPRAGSYPQHTGTVFRVTPSGDVTVVFVFGVHARDPYAGVTPGPDGRLYGLTSSDGDTGCGTLYSLALDGSDFKVQYHFDHLHAGCQPMATMALGPDQKLYGTTQFGGPKGAVGGLFRYDPATARLNTLHVFHDDDPVGSDPVAGVSVDAHGAIYGTTAFGGPTGHGAIYRRMPDGSIELLRAFARSGKDGENPQSAPAVDGSHHLVGSTLSEGESGGGTVWRLKLPH